MSRIFRMPVAEVYHHYINKVERKGRTQEELTEVVCWLTGFSPQELQEHLDRGTTFEEFFATAPMSVHAHLITGVVCGVRVENVADPLMRQIRQLDKVVDELARGKKIDRIKRGATSTGKSQKSKGRSASRRPAQEPAMRPTGESVEEVIDRLPEKKRADAVELLGMMKRITGETPIVWAGKILGFGEYRYEYASGHGGRAPLAAFAPTPKHQTVYLVAGFQDRYPQLVEQLPAHPEAQRGKPKLSTACLYLTSLESVHRNILEQLIERSVHECRE